MTVTSKQITVTSIVAAAGIIGGALAYTVDWAIKTDAQLGYADAERDSLYTLVAQLDYRLTKAERRLRIVSKRAVVATPPPKQGLVRRLLSKLF